MQLIEMRGVKIMPRFMKSLNNISRAQTNFRRARLDDSLPPNMHTYILAICAKPGMTQDEIASDICVNKSTVARRIDWCLENGYVTRNPAPEDKRCLCVYPTEKAISLLPSIKAVAREWTELITEGIDEGELEIFHSVLLKIEERAKEASEI